MDIRIKRIYDDPDNDDGRRVLVDRLWPRGLSRERAALDAWLKEVAPSDELRKWFGHRDERWAEFRRSYLEELDGNRSRLLELKEMCRDGTVTLLFAARHEEQNNAAVIREWLRTRAGA